MASFLEDKNKEWLSLIRGWHDRLKDDQLALDDDGSDGGGSFILLDFKRRQRGLETHLESLSTWLKNNVSLGTL